MCLYTGGELDKNLRFANKCSSKFYFCRLSQILLIPRKNVWTLINFIIGLQRKLNWVEINFLKHYKFAKFFPKFSGKRRDAFVRLRQQPGWPGTDVMIFKIFSPKNSAKKLAFLTQNKASFCKNCDHNIGFWEKRQFFRRKIVENRRKLWS
jgi:hypothetical protein